jgi:cytidine diphosphoramidate kinase
VSAQAPGRVIWITGLPGSGKTTISEELVPLLRERGLSVARVDGDVIRRVMGGDLGYTRHDRLLNAQRISRLCAELAGQGLTVVCATVSLFHEVHAWNREHCPGLCEVLLEVRPETLLERNQKGLYSGALAGEVEHVPGLNQACELPQAPHLVIQNDAGVVPREAAAKVLRYLEGGEL